MKRHVKIAYLLFSAKIYEAYRTLNEIERKVFKPKKEFFQSGGCQLTELSDVEHLFFLNWLRSYLPR